MLEVLLVEDDSIVRSCIADALRRRGHTVTEAGDGEEAAALAQTSSFDVAVCDVHIPKLDGLTLLRRLRREARTASFVMMTSFACIDDAVAAVREGALEYVTKPFDPEEFAETVIRSIDERNALRKRFEQARAAREEVLLGGRFVASTPPMKRLLDRVSTLAQSDAPVLITAEPGTGKKTLARLLHERGPRRNGPFEVFSCAQLPDLMLESELGDLTDLRPQRYRDAWFRTALGGTLVLDGVDRLPWSAQADLLRIIQEPDLLARRTGGWQPIGVRLVSLARAGFWQERSFLQPLFYRLNTVGLEVPSLRERKGEWLELVAELLAQATPPSRTAPTLAPPAWRALTRHPFPGNVAELRAVVQRAAVLADGATIEEEHVTEALGAQRGEATE